MLQNLPLVPRDSVSVLVECRGPGPAAQSPSATSLRLSAPLPSELGSKSSSAPLLVKPPELAGCSRTYQGRRVS